MNESLKKLSAEVAKEIGEILSSDHMKAFIADTKAVNEADAGTFEVVVSTNAVDRQGESVDQNGWDLTLFKMNPVVLFGHDYYSLPIGVCDSIELVDGKLVAKGRFASAEANPFAQQVRKLYDEKILRATSVGFIVKESNGNVITKAELLEFSFVPVPANPYALSMRQVETLGLNLEMLHAKGLEIDAKEETPAADPAPKEEEKPAEETPAADPAPTDPAPEAAADDEKEKGMVADALEGDTPAIREAKWNNLDKVFNILNAFIDAYMHPLTDVQKFDELVAEFAQLCASQVSNETKAAEAIKAMIESRAKEIADGKTVKNYIAKDTMDPNEDPAEDAAEAQQIGSILATLQGGVDTLIKEASSEILAIVSDPNEKTIKKDVVVGPKGTGDDTGEEHGESRAPSQRSNSAGRNAADMEAWLQTRAVLRAIATATTDALEGINTRIRKEREN